MAKSVEQFLDLNTGGTGKPGVPYVFFPGAFWRATKEHELHIHVWEASGRPIEDIMLAGLLVGDSETIFVNGDGSSSLGQGGKVVFAGDPQPAITFIKNLTGAEGKSVIDI